MHSLTNMNVLLASVLVLGSAEISHTVLNNGVKMPMLAVQPEKYPPQSIEGIVKTALQTGINSIDAATFSYCQLRVGAALKGVQRNSFFLTAGIMLEQNISSTSAYAAATGELHSTLSNLGMQYVDLMVVSRPATTCGAIQEQWRALEDFYAAGKARAIGVRVFCPASLKCIMTTAKVTPALNQIFYHVGMGADPEGFKSAFNEAGAATQSIRALDSGELVSGKLVTSIGKAHKWSGAQVSMRWVLDHDVSLSTPMSSQEHMEEALALFQDHLTPDELSVLDNATSPSDCPVFCPSSKMCPPLEEQVVV
eukprot:TRINITY_DN64288_c0_g1_i1.p1 TRINITY_DN64288_c0_g1~~TRINITY_DN64288_c0_g1_i1.p1  ORF type:complete len:309 (+),score=57.15 TRINITY_DN64288_c0_g1_i1:51-977(+)